MKVSWDDEIPNIWKDKKMFQTTNQITYEPILVLNSNRMYYNSQVKLIPYLLLKGNKHPR